MSTGDRGPSDRDAMIRRIRNRIADIAVTLPLKDRIRCGTGWRSIIESFVTDAEKLPGFGLLSASEKFGALRLKYVCDDIAAVADLDKAATRQSLQTCEFCGRPGELRKAGCWKTTCDDHIRARLTSDGSPERDDIQ